MPVSLEKQIEIEDRRTRVLELRLQRVTFEEIAGIVGVTPMTVYRDYNMALKKHRDNTLRAAGELKVQNKQRLETMIDIQTRALEKGDDKAADRLMRAIDMLNRMYHVYGDNAAPGNALAAGSGIVVKFEQHNLTIHRDAPGNDALTSTPYLVMPAAHTDAMDTADVDVDSMDTDSIDNAAAD